MATKKRIYAQIAKVEDQDDGTLKVWGYASSGSEDSDGETVTPECMKAALPDYMKFGAVREMHQPLAAGTAIEATVEPDGKTWFGAHVVDPIAIKKVQTQVYKGFSIGGKVTERDPMNKKIIKGLKLVEVSLVDRPANPDAVFMLAKAETTPEDDVVELAEMLDAGEVTPAQVLALVKASKAQPASTGAVSEEPVDEAAKAATTGSLGSPPKGGVTTLEPVQAETLIKKGMYSVSRMAELIQSIAYLVQDTEYEAEYEGDASPVPAQLRDWLKSGAAIFGDMAAEEVAELIAAATKTAAAQKAAKADDIAKAGARFSKATKEALSAIHGACKTACDHLDGMKYADDSVEEADNAVDMTKAATEDDTAGTLVDQINKAVSTAIAPLNDELVKLRKDKEELSAKLNAMPAPGRALLKAVAISKMQDSQDDNATQHVEPTPPPEGTYARAEWEMRKAHAQRAGKRFEG